jgi:hypothetical protein
MTFKPIQLNAQYLRLYVRTATTDPNAPYTLQAGIPRGDTGFVWDASAWAPAPPARRCSMILNWQPLIRGAHLLARIWLN